MIYLFSGDDAKNKLLSYEKFIKSLPAQAGILPTETFFISRNNFDQTQIESLYSGAGLFFSKCAVIFKGILENEETREFVLEKLEFMDKSDNSFIFLESKLNKPILDAFKKALPAGRQVMPAINTFLLLKEAKEKFDNFLLANAFFSVDPKAKVNLWVCFRQAIDRGVVMEELIGVLFWKIKDALLKKNFSKFKESELKGFASKISYLLPEARKDGRDAESAFEQFLLEAF